MVQKHNLGTFDYIIICLSLIISAVIGIAAKYYGGKQKTAREYLLAGKNMAKFPVIFSIVVTLVSAFSILAVPVEVYRFGIGIYICIFMIPIGMFLASVVLIPVYFQCGVSTVTEFLEMRYGNIIRYMVSVVFLIQMMSFIAIALYGAVLALSAVTNLSLEMSIVSLGAVCALYCSVGGLKAVLWADVFQATLMFICVFSIYTTGIRDGGGISKIYQQAKEGQRLVLFDFKWDLTRRYGFWVCLVHGTITGFAMYGTNQIQVQRMLSLSTIDRAKSTLRISTIPVMLTYLTCSSVGLLLYSIYFNCDPILNKEQTGLKKYDQIIPAYVVNTFHSIPGMTGLCIAGIFSASLSTISSALNSAATVTVIDFIKPFYRKGNISDFKIILMTKIISLIYGAIGIGLSFLFLKATSLQHLLQVLLSAPQGVIFGVFLIGVLTRKVSDKSISVAVFLSYMIVAWLSIGSLTSKYSQTPLPLSASSCPYLGTNSSVVTPSCLNEANCTASMISTKPPPKEIFFLYKISFMWHNVLGLFLTLFFSAIAVLITGWRNNVVPIDSKCLSPVTKLWMKKTTENKENNILSGFETSEQTHQL
ncbi:sodium-coupled monocarboxylate transporter 1 [Parasteatoda tepidariorum]|uniref:sodium-coupled monocarboxylate transporter 1 n=1 Tax=Parasteatoda tepidariorum TaxID=114398 RepID=UPI001C72732D|nr:sodium-coupled monocarboxylate transporter 1 [Parasteatoda tepidariorum]